MIDLWNGGIVNYLHVKDFEISRDGEMAIFLDVDGASSILVFNFEKFYNIHSDAVAACIGLLVRRTYQRITFGFPVSSEMISLLSKHTEAVVTASRSCAPEVHQPSNNVVLGFSGGFDSLTARDLLPENVQLFSYDFQGAFSRERAMFQQFSTQVIQTNLVELGLNKSSWAFMAVGARLLKSALGVGVLSFGTVIEAREKYIRSFTAQRQLRPSTMLDLTSLNVFNPILGMTEVGTAKYVSERYANQLPSILRSVANPGEEKSYRKTMLLEAVKPQGAPTLLSKEPEFQKNQNIWGKNMALDFLSIYLMSELGTAPVQLAYETVIPEEAIILSERTDLSFYKKINSNFYSTKWAPSDLVRRSLSQAIENGIYPYSTVDYEAFASVSAYLKKAATKYLASTSQCRP